MALSQKITAYIKDCDTLTVKDITYPYSSANVGGWGTPNLDTVDITNATLTITDPNGVIDTQDITSNFVSPVQGEFIIYNGSLVSVDGVYQLSVTVEGTLSGSNVSYTTTFSFLNLCNIRCCLSQKWVKYLKTCSICSEVDLELMRAESIYQGLKRGLTVCGNESLINEKINLLKKLCNTTCKTC